MERNTERTTPVGVATQGEQPANPCCYVRLAEIPARWPVFRRSMWAQWIADGTIPSRLIGRARIVRVADIEAFLSGQTEVTR